MPDAFGGTTILDLIGRTAAGKHGGGQGPPQAYGQAGDALAPQQPDQQGGDQGADPSSTDSGVDFAAGAKELDPISRYRLHEMNLETMSRFAGPGGPRGGGMGPSTSHVLALHGNKLRAEAENYERYLRELQLSVELGRLGIDPEHRESGTERAIREEQQKTTSPQSVTPGGYNPNPAQPAGQPPAKY